MEQNVFNKTCDAVDLTLCTQYYVDPCDCTKFYQCAQNQRRMFHQPCGPGRIYNHNILVCDYPNDAICQPLRPWERCSVTESRMKQLIVMCVKNVPATNPQNNDQNTNMQMMETLLPTTFGVLVLAMLIGLAIYRYKRLKKIHLPDPPNSTPENWPSETIRFNPMYGVEPTQPSVSDSSPTPNENVTPRDEVSGGSTVSSQGSSYIFVVGNDSTPRPSEMPGASDDDREFTYIGVQNGNRPEGGIVSSEDGSYAIIGEPGSSPDPLAMPRPYNAYREFTDRAIQRRNTQEEEKASSEDSSYELVLQSDPTARPSVMAHPSDADREFPLFHPYISGNGPWPHKVIFNTKEHYLPCHERAPCTNYETT